MNPIVDYLVPTVIEKEGAGERAFDIYSRLLKDRIIMLSSPVDADSASLVIAQLLFLDSEDPDRDIKLYINSPGGSITDGLAIYDTMQLVKADVCTICVGMAASMGAFLLAGGAKGKRYCLPNSEVLIHQPLIGGNGISGQATDIKIESDHLQAIKKRLHTLLAQNTGKTYEQIVADTERDHWLTAEEALEYGLVDQIVTKKDKVNG